MRRLTLPLCVALALITVVAIWMFTSANGARSAHRVVDARGDAPVTNTGESTNVQTGEAAPARSEAQALTIEDAPQKSAALSGREVVPVTGALERRVQDAQLWWCAAPEGDPPTAYISTAERLRDCALETHLETSALQLAPDEAGRFFLDAEARRGTIVARAPGLFGTLDVRRPGVRPLRVALEPDQALQVRVVDTNGAPVAGVQVALRQFYSGAHFNDHGRARTDAEGVALLPHYRALIGGDWDFTAQYALSIAEPLSPTVNHFFEVAQPPAGRVELVLPPCGSVELQLPPGDEIREVGLEPLGVGPHEERDWPSFTDGWRRPANDVVLFPFVGLELELVPATRGEFAVASHTRSRLRGPRVAGEKIVAHLSPLEGLVRVRGRLLDADGVVLAAHYVTATCSTSATEQEDGVELAVESVRSNANGEFQLAFAHRDALELDLTFGVSSKEHQMVGEVQRTNLARRGAELDLGDLRLERWQVIASGVVVDALGNPAPEAHVEVYVAAESRHDSGAVRVRWQPLYGSHNRAGVDGAFELRAATLPDRIAVVAFTETASRETLECRGGASGLRLVLTQGGEIVGRISSAADTRFDYLSVHLTCVEFLRPQLTEQRRFHPFLDTNGEFAIRGLPEGRYELEVERQGFEAPLVKLDAIHVRVGGAPDPRLNPLVLRERPELVEVRLVDARDRPVSDASLLRVRTTANGPEVESVGYTSSRMLVDRGSPPLWVLADGFAALEFDPATVGHTLRLARAPLLRIEFAPGCEFPRDGVDAWIDVTPLDRASELGGWLMTRIRPAAHGAQTQVGFLGRVRLDLWLGGESMSQVPLEVLGGGTLVETSLAQTATLKFEPSALRRALEEVGQDQ